MRETKQTEFPWQWILAALCALYFFLLGAMPLANPDEGRYAEIPREMLESGDWVSPRLNAVVYFEKPPLMYWVNAVCLRLLGPGEASMRLPPVLFALLGIGMTVYTARRIYGVRAGWISGIVLASSILYFALARILILDMAVSVLTAGCLFCFMLGMRAEAGRERRLWFLGLYAFAALATLAKGLIGVAIPGAVMFLWLLVFNQWRQLLPFHLLSGTALFLAIALPWHLLAADRNPQWAHFYFVQEHWQRFTSPIHARTAPWWFFIPILLVGLFPWTGLVIPAVKRLATEGWSRRHQHLETWFLIVWTAFIFLFFSYSNSKLAPYILPVFPAVAIFIGAAVARAFEQSSPNELKPGLWINAGLLLLLGIAFLAVSLKPTLIRQADIANSLRPYAVGLGLGIGGVSLLSIFFLLRSKVRGALALHVAGMALFLMVICVLAPKIITRNTKDLAQTFRERSTDGESIYHYRGFFHDFLFYSGRLVGTVDHIGELQVPIDPVARKSGRFIDETEFLRQWEGPGRIWVVARKSEAIKLFSRPGFIYLQQGENPQHVLFTNR